jgi:pSer/pThr/pTyr-binding forkhead associated (FHA) protein
MNFKTLRVGRANDNDIVIDHSSVSRYHLEIFYDSEGNVFLTDLNSVNGTFVNGKRINGSVQLNNNDNLKAGVSNSINWQNYKPSILTKDIKNTNDFNNKSSVNNEKVLPKQNVFKTIGLTLSILIGIIVILYFLNEKVFTDSKPTSLDPEKPNDTSSNQPDKIEVKSDKKITYDFSCLEDQDDLGTTKIIDVLEEIDNNVTNTIGGEISLDKEIEIGNQLLSDCKKEYQFIESGNKINNIRKILEILSENIVEPKGFDYSIYLIKSDELNAFTAGAKIFITTRMYEFCKSNDELACVIGHEINHNELGHIKQYLQKEKILTSSGAALSKMFTIPFGQKKESHCDFKGIDLAISSGYNGCVNISLWKRMKAESEEGDYDALENLFRSHPYSEKRSVCSKNHILTNYGFDCSSSK